MVISSGSGSPKDSPWAEIGSIVAALLETASSNSARLVSLLKSENGYRAFAPKTKF